MDSFLISPIIQNISLLHGDITQASTDAIVNAANSIMLGGGGVDGAIHRAAGPRLLEECRKVNKVNGERCPVGQARITPSGDLPCNYVIHTVGPRYRQVQNPKDLLASAYRESLRLAVQYNLSSIAFPAISCGSYGYPLEDAAYIAMTQCRRKTYSGIDIYFYLYSEKIFTVWRDIFNSLAAGDMQA